MTASTAERVRTLTASVVGAYLIISACLPVVSLAVMIVVAGCGHGGGRSTALQSSQSAFDLDRDGVSDPILFCVGSPSLLVPTRSAQSRWGWQAHPLSLDLGEAEAVALIGGDPPEVAWATRVAAGWLVHRAVVRADGELRQTADAVPLPDPENADGSRPWVNLLVQHGDEAGLAVITESAAWVLDGQEVRRSEIPRACPVGQRTPFVTAGHRPAIVWTNTGEEHAWTVCGAADASCDNRDIAVATVVRDALPSDRLRWLLFAPYDLDVRLVEYDPDTNQCQTRSSMRLPRPLYSRRTAIRNAHGRDGIAIYSTTSSGQLFMTVELREDAHGVLRLVASHERHLPGGGMVYPIGDVDGDGIMDVGRAGVPWDDEGQFVAEWLMSMSGDVQVAGGKCAESGRWFFR